MERTPWTFDAILAIAGKIRSGSGPLSPTFYKCLEEAQGIARSSLFGPVVRKEAVQGEPRHLSLKKGSADRTVTRYAAPRGLEYEWLAAEWACDAYGVGPRTPSRLGETSG